MAEKIEKVEEVGNVEQPKEDITTKEPEKGKTEHTLDDQPKTGIFDMKLLIGIAMVIFTVIVAKNKRKNA